MFLFMANSIWHSTAEVEIVWGRDDVLGTLEVACGGQGEMSREQFHSSHSFRRGSTAARDPTIVIHFHIKFWS